jgi:hypothetical protein
MFVPDGFIYLIVTRHKLTVHSLGGEGVAGLISNEEIDSGVL